ncbi:lipase (class 2) domain-containing protein [Ditylenchus destructor]|nr:lipase (class 2) domain-containing protein [Ditylenchus destructor]
MPSAYRNSFTLFRISALSIYFISISLCSSEFTNDFRAFLHNRYGLAVVNQLERRDLGADASLGGRSGDEPFLHESVIIVHGITNKITRFNGVTQALRAQGYTSGEIYGTTWGDGGVTPAGLVEMKCAYVKQIRSMIIAVREYTGRKVDVVGYSMGSPLARKAILGGNCVDTREVLGPPLTEHIDTFLSVAGANYGSSLCIVPIPLGTCNKRNGLHCESEFLSDINAQMRYEAEHIFSIFSTSDEKVGFRTCSRLASPIVGQNGYVKKSGYSHDDVLDKTLDIQINFITKHKPR